MAIQQPDHPDYPDTVINALCERRNVLDVLGAFVRVLYDRDERSLADSLANVSIGLSYAPRNVAPDDRPEPELHDPEDDTPEDFEEPIAP